MAMVGRAAETALFDNTKTLDWNIVYVDILWSTSNSVYLRMWVFERAMPSPIGYKKNYDNFLLEQTITRNGAW